MEGKSKAKIKYEVQSSGAVVVIRPDEILGYAARLADLGDDLECVKSFVVPSIWACALLALNLGHTLYLH